MEYGLTKTYLKERQVRTMPRKKQYRAVSTESLPLETVLQGRISSLDPIPGLVWPIRERSAVNA